MSANEFEKQMQQKMGGFNLSPSDEVWLDVERRLRKENKKKRFFFWIFFLGLMLGAGIFITKWTGTEKNGIPEPINNISTNTKKNLAAATNDSTIITKAEAEKISQSATDNNTQTVTAKKREAKEDNPKYETTGKNVSQIDPVKKRAPLNDLPGRNKIIEPVQKDETVLKKVIAEKMLITNHVNEPEIKKTETVQSKIEIKSDTMQEMVAENKEAIKMQNKIDPAKSYADSSESDKKELEKDFVVIKIDSTVNRNTESLDTIQHKKTGKWKWALMLQSGISGIAEGISFLNNNSYADAYSYSSPSSSSGGIPPYSFASPVRTGGSFAIGISASHPVSKKLDINFGLAYSYLSTKRNVGARVDSVLSLSGTDRVNNFYLSSNINNQTYRNQYHFLKISTELSWKLFQLKKLPVSWNNSLSYDRLLASNALRFDRNLPGYYKNLSALTHNHFFLTTGLSVPLLKRFELNPYAAWSLTQVWRTAGSSPTHFTDYGLRVKILLNKKVMQR